MLRWLRKLLGEVLPHVPVVLFLTALCMLVHDSGWYAKVEGLSVMVVGALAPDQALPEKLPDTVAITASPDFFYAEYRGRLPLRRDVTAEVVNTLRKKHPRLIALDLDVSRTGESDDEKKEAASLIEAIRAALDEGIDVVAVAYPMQEGVRRPSRDEGLKALCAELQPAAPNRQADTAPKNPAQTPGIFVLASPMLAPEQSFNIVHRVSQSPADGQREDHRLFAVTSALLSQDRKPANLCKGADVDSAALHSLDNAEREWPDLKKMHRIRFMVDKDSNPVVGIPVSSKEQLGKVSEAIGGRTVFFGVQSFQGMDDFLTPLGRMPGAQLQAHIANSWSKGGMSQEHLHAALWDVLIGLGFVLAYVIVHHGLSSLEGVQMKYCASLGGLALPLVIFGAFSWIVFCLSTRKLMAGEWLDPLPMVAGLTLHLYAESNGKGHHGHPTLFGWFGGIFSAMRRVIHADGALAKIDALALIVCRLVMIGFVCWAISSIVHHERVHANGGEHAVSGKHLEPGQGADLRHADDLGH